MIFSTEIESTDVPAKMCFNGLPQPGYCKLMKLLSSQTLQVMQIKREICRGNIYEYTLDIEVIRRLDYTRRHQGCHNTFLSLCSWVGSPGSLTVES